MINRALLPFLLAASFASSSLAHDSDLTGILTKSDQDDTLYILELDGGNGTLPLRGDCLNDIPEGFRIWVSGELKTEIYIQDSPSDSFLSPKRWRVFLQAHRCYSISDPFITLEPTRVTLNGQFKNLAEILESISRQTGWSMVTGPEAKDAKTAMSLNCENIKAEKLLGEVLGKQGFTFRLVGQTLVITSKDVIKALPPERPLQEIIQAAEQGDPHYQWLLGMSFFRGGKGLKQDFQLAALWLTKSAEHDYAEAQYDLAEMYYRGFGIPKNPEQAMIWYAKAADQGDERAQRALQRISDRTKK